MQDSLRRGSLETFNIVSPVPDRIARPRRYLKKQNKITKQKIKQTRLYLACLTHDGVGLVAACITSQGWVRPMCMHTR